MRGPLESQVRMALAYWSSRGPSYRFSTRYFWAVAGEGRCQIIISSRACSRVNLVLTPAFN